MTDTPRHSGRKDAPAARADRLKAALRANIARRKAQSRARRVTEQTDAGRQCDGDGDTNDVD